jgi:hypothetical protein
LHSDPRDVPSCTKNESGRPDGASSTPTDTQTSGAPPPAGDALLSRTIAIWQPRTERTLSETDAREIVSNVARLFVLLDEWDRRASEETERPVEGTVNHAR